MNEKNKMMIKDLVRNVKNAMRSSKFDPNGSYTGVCEHGEKPVQDQDDL